MEIQKIHHVAYRCNDAKETVEFYEKVLNMDFMRAIAEDRVPSTKEPDPYIHVFLDAGNRNVLAFFDLPNSPPLGSDPNTADWVQHIAFQPADETALLEAKSQIVGHGVDVLGPIDLGIFVSIYFHDPNRHRSEPSYWKSTQEQLDRLADVAPAMLEQWSTERTVRRHADWLHHAEFDQDRSA